jgi:hypothetical protein
MSSSVRQKSPIKVQHAQETTELINRLWKGIVLEMNHSFSHWSGTFSRYFITEESDLGCEEDALGRINDSVCVKTAEENP